MAYVPSYRPERRAPGVQLVADDRERWSTRRFLTVLLAASAAGWAAVAGLAILIAR